MSSGKLGPAHRVFSGHVFRQAGTKNAETRSAGRVGPALACAHDRPRRADAYSPRELCAAL